MMGYSQRRFAAGERLQESAASDYVADLYQAIDEHYQTEVMGSPWMQALMAGALTIDQIRSFWQNWYGFVSEINNFNGIVYQRFNGFYKRHSDLQAAYADKIADELIHPTAPGHIQIVLAQGRALGLTDEDMVDFQMNAKCRAWMEWFRGLAYEGNLAEFWSGHQVEQCIGDWSGKFREALRDHYSLADDQLEYFRVHQEADLTVHEGGIIPHAEFNRRMLIRLLTEGEGQTRPGFTIGYGARLTIEYFRLFLDGCW